MKTMITANILIDKLSHHKLICAPAVDGKRCFSRLALFNKHCEISDSVIYVGEYEQMETSAHKNGAALFVCTGARSRSINSSCVPQGMIIVDDCDNLLELYDEINSLLCDFAKWILHMQSCVICGGTTKDILDASEPVLKNFIMVTDSGFKLVEHGSMPPPPNDPVSTGLVKLGYHSHEIVKGFQKTGRLKCWAENDGAVIINTEQKMTPYDVVGKIFRYQNHYYEHMVMVCSNRALTNGLVDLFEIFVEFYVLCAKRTWQDKQNATRAYASFITDLLEGKCTENDIVDRAKTVGISFHGQFTLAKLSCSKELSPRWQIVQRIADNFPNAKPIFYAHSIVVLFVFSHLNGEHTSDPTSFLAEMGLTCGISAPFTCLAELPNAYEQAEIALSYLADRDALSAAGDSATNLCHDRICTFESIYDLYLLTRNRHKLEIASQSRYFKILKLLHEHDSKSGREQCRFLFTYLSCGKNSSKTGELLHMHRNNALYHVRRIEEITGIDFGDEHECRCVLALYKTLLVNKCFERGLMQ